MRFPAGETNGTVSHDVVAAPENYYDVQYRVDSREYQIVALNPMPPEDGSHVLVRYDQSDPSTAKVLSERPLTQPDKSPVGYFIVAAVLQAGGLFYLRLVLTMRRRSLADGTKDEVG